MRVLIVEDDAEIAGVIVDYLHERGHKIDWAATPAQALLRLEQSSFDVLILDRGLPRMEGLRLLEIIRQELTLDIPVLVLTARDTEVEKLQGFAAGADDYVVKPFSLAELEARLAVLVRRYQPRSHSSALVLGDIRFDRERYELRVSDQLRTAGPKVMKLIEFLLQQAGRVVSYEQIEELLWGEPQESSDRLRQVLYQARRLLEGSQAVSIVSVHGKGCRMEEKIENH